MGHGKKVLVVEDSPTIREHVSMVFENLGFTVITAKDGTEGLSYINGINNISLIVSDINMPKMDGISMLEKIRAQERFKDIPVIMLTSEATIDLVRRARDQRVSGYLLKPPTQEKVQALVEKIFPDLALVA